jgi:hypothetical protein
MQVENIRKPENSELSVIFKARKTELQANAHAYSYKAIIPHLYSSYESTGNRLGVIFT